MPTPATFFVAGLMAFLAGALSGLALWRQSALARMVTSVGAAVGSLLIAAAGAGAIARGTELSWTLPGGGAVFAFAVRLDPLSGWFLLAFALLAYAAAVYSFGYLKHMETTRNLGALGFFLNLMLLSLALVFTAANAFFFLAAWELMALTAYCLVAFEHEKAESRRAAILFLVMSHAGAALVMIGMLLLSTAGKSLAFADFHLLASKMPPAQQATIFLLFLIGFGVKAGIVPLHVWLPDAHPVAPSNISALMSGIVIKTGIYGMARVFFEFFGPMPLWMGSTVLAAGVVAALVGVLYALQEHDLKRLLAYHSIENIGIILMGFGASMMFRALDHPLLASIALVAAIYHTMNHAIFKGLLFLSAGAVVQSTGTRNMEEMGGLIRPMPATSLFFLVGAVAISGLPPLNGFVSEWLTYQALFAGFGATGSLARMMFPIAGSLLALTAALAAVCFVKAFAIPFLALPRSEESAHARECPVTMRMGMEVLAAACFVLGLGATRVIPLLDPITQQTFGVAASRALVPSRMVLQAGSAHAGSVSTNGIAILLVVFMGAAILLAYFRLRHANVVVGPTWDCGLPGLAAENEYTATAFSKPLRLIFAAFYRPRREIRPEYEVSPYYPSAIRFESEIEPAFEKRVYEPLRAWIFGVARQARAIQAGSVHAYLAYIFVTLIALLLWGVRQ